MTGRYRIELYRKLTLRGWRWFWRVRAYNGQIVATGHDGYHNFGDALETAENVTGHRFDYDTVE